MFHDTYGYADSELSPKTLWGYGGVITIVSAATMSYMADAENDYRYGWTNEEGEVPAWGDYRVWTALASGTVATFLQMRGMTGLATAAGAIGLGAVVSFTASEGMRWRESGKVLGATLPALPTLGQTEPAVTAAPVELEVVETMSEAV
jgi:hypothetical protein